MFIHTLASIGTYVTLDMSVQIEIRLLVMSAYFSVDHYVFIMSAHARSKPICVQILVKYSALRLKSIMSA